MSQNLLSEKLAQANGNVRKLSEFFCARREWGLADGAEESAQDLLAAASKINEHLNALLRAGGAEPLEAVRPPAEPLAAGTHDETRLSRFTTFLRDLDTWLTAQHGPSSEPDVISALQEMESNLSCIVTVIQPITAKSEADETEDLASNADGPKAAAAPGDAVPDATDTDSEGRPRQLILDDTDAHPMVQEFQSMHELTPACEKLLDNFLAAWDVEYSYYNRKKLLERTLRWITSAPEGQVLVIKMKTAEEPYEPYPSYISRDVLAGKPPVKDPWS